MPTWIKFADKQPTHKQLVWYFFHRVGVHAGAYNAEKNYFYGVSGFLTDDVTHWMPIADCKPEAPQ